jgi:hypothetical protein
MPTREASEGIVNLTDFASFGRFLADAGLRTFNGLEASVMHSNCSNLLKLTMPLSRTIGRM